MPQFLASEPAVPLVICTRKRARQLRRLVEFSAAPRTVANPRRER
jgi:hypothetical protein